MVWLSEDTDEDTDGGCGRCPLCALALPALEQRSVFLAPDQAAFSERQTPGSGE